MNYVVTFQHAGKCRHRYFYVTPRPMFSGARAGGNPERRSPCARPPPSSASTRASSAARRASLNAACASSVDNPRLELSRMVSSLLRMHAYSRPAGVRDLPRASPAGARSRPRAHYADRLSAPSSVRAAARVACQAGLERDSADRRGGPLEDLGREKFRIHLTPPDT